MREDLYVYCTQCAYCKLDDIGHTNCGYEEECCAWDPEDGRRLSDRPKFKGDNIELRTHYSDPLHPLAENALKEGEIGEKPWIFYSLEELIDMG